MIKIGIKIDKYLGWMMNANSHSDSLTLFRSRMVISIALVAIVTSYGTGIPFIVFLGDPSGYITVVYGILVSIILFLFRLGLSTNNGILLLEIVTGLHFLFCRAIQDRMDWPLVMWLTVFPIIRLLYSGIKQGFFGLIYAGFLMITMFHISDLSIFEKIIPLNDVISLLRGISFICALFLITVVFDSLRREAIERAEEATKVRTLFLANMSHELRTPMNGVIGITELILAGSISEANRIQLELVKRSGIQMVSLINDILDLTRLESSRLKLENVPTDIRIISEDVIALLQSTADQKNLRMLSEIDPQIPSAILSDPTRLKQILSNILNNAVKFTSKGEVILKANLIGNRIHFAISDTGIGISEEIQKKLFVPFEQADVSFTRRYGGSGLGLAISRKLVHLMGGVITLKSKLGIGSTFLFDLPCIPCSPNPILKIEQSESLDSKIPPKILVVEDNEVNIYVVLSMLKKFGCYTEIAKDGREAIETLINGEFDLILMDCHMPNMDGFEATKLIRKMADPFKSIPIIALTASALSEDIELCRLAGMDFVLTKPLDMLKLKNTIDIVRLNGRKFTNERL